MVVLYLDNLSTAFAISEMSSSPTCAQLSLRYSLTSFLML